MGAFSPTIANIFMSVILRWFLRTQRYHSLPSLYYTYSSSTERRFSRSHHLQGPTLSVHSPRMFQKPQNLYQYLHFESYHQKSVHKGKLTECVWYVRTNTSKDKYIQTVHLFKTRLQARNYPPEFVNKTTALVSYDDRRKYLQQSKPEKTKMWPPLFKCIPPPQFQMLK